jgi:hypothetical protein
MKDDVAISGKNFEKNPSKLRLTQVLTIFQGASAAEKQVLGSLYPDLEATRAALTGRDARKQAIASLLEPLKNAQ